MEGKDKKTQKKEFSWKDVDLTKLVQHVRDFGVVWLKLCCQAQKKGRRLNAHIVPTLCVSATAVRTF